MHQNALSLAMQPAILIPPPPFRAALCESGMHFGFRVPASPPRELGLMKIKVVQLEKFRAQSRQRPAMPGMSSRGSGLQNIRLEQQGRTDVWL
ncbi:hypothetical protein [Mesorhizobium sp.]|uniref:hypothetical protein n=1 Tax=Mesorhizobium sp. TaxID=1871066 RepID=UPI000FE4E026|nr:hypothetical protein [Mesorhizobium sp.]RWA69081.1 MAG: hypothetical protein EOQ29_17990 [Mesorhizobium sp.]RWA81649.1 MAG: hypothetical protein EOQ30_17835 [Mesorhizobium sp.]